MGQMNFSVEGSKPDNPAVNRSKLYPKSDGWYRLDSAGNEVKLTDADDVNLDVATRNNVHVSKSGNDTTGDGSISSPFLTIGAAVTYINANYTPSSSDNYCIMVAAGNYTENAFTLPRFVSLWGTHYRTRIIASSGNIDLISSNGAHTIRDVLLTGVTGAGNYHIKGTYTADTRLLIQNVAIIVYETTGTISNGVYLSNTAGTFLCEFEAIDFGDVTGNCIEINNNVSAVVRGVQLFDCGAATFLDADGNCTYSLTNVDTDDDGASVGVDHGNTGDSDVTNCNLRLMDTPIIKANSGKLLVQNVAIVSGGAQITNFEGLSGIFYDEIEGADTVRIVDGLAVGLPDQSGSPTNLGEGGPTTLGVKTYTYNGSSFVDVSTAATSSSGSTFTFPTGGSTSEIYVSMFRTNIDTSDYMTFQGVQIDCDTAATSDGEFVAEYWNGSTWAEFNTMSSAIGGNYYPYGKALFERTGDEHIRFTKLITDDWAKSNTVGIGVSTYWMRFRIETEPTVIPVFQRLKIHTNNTAFNADGYIEYFGNARPVLSFNLPNFESANNSPSDQDIYFQDNFGIGKRENEFVEGAVDQASQIVYLPSSICTSCPVRLRAVFVSNSTNTSDADFTIRWIVNKEGDNIYWDATSAPTTNPSVQSLNVSVSPTGQYEQVTLEAELDVSDYIADNTEGKPDVLGIQIQRNGNTDAHSGNLALCAANLFYVKANEGTHI